MRYYNVITLLASRLLVLGHEVRHGHDQASMLYASDVDPAPRVPLETHEHWMRVAVQALYDLVSPCPFAAYGTAIVNHTGQHGIGELVCIGANAVGQTGNPTLHGEIAAIDNCTAVLTDPNGAYKLTAAEANAAWADLTLYTTAEACPMCSTAIRWAGFKGYVYATSIDTLVKFGWKQPSISSREVFARSKALDTETYLVPEVLTRETDPLLSWQFDPNEPCPKGCSRPGEEEGCEAD